MTRDELRECLESAVNEAIAKSARVRLVLLEMAKLDIASVEMCFELSVDRKGNLQRVATPNEPKIDDAQFLRSMGIVPDLEWRG